MTTENLIKKKKNDFGTSLEGEGESYPKLPQKIVIFVQKQAREIDRKGLLYADG